MKKVLLLMIVLVFVLSAAAPKLRLTKFTVVNKSGGDIALRLVPKTSESNMTYYLNIPSGDKAYPFTKVYSTQTNKYDVQITFFKTKTVYDENGSSYLVTDQVCALWDYPNLNYNPPTIDLTRNNELVVLPCNQRAKPANLGEPGHLKFWYPGYVGFVDEPAPTFKWHWIPVWDYIY